MTKEEEILAKLSAIIDPDLGQDIVTLGFVKNIGISDEGDVTFEIELTTPACPVKEEFRQQAVSLVKELPWVDAVNVTMTAQPNSSQFSRQGLRGMNGVKNIIAVSSCKGGVGKSTVSVNLAYSLARTGAKVGIFDADIFGPSLPTMVKLDDTDIYQQDGLIVPLEYLGVKLMSFGYVNQSDDAAVMRGAMVSQVLGQLLGDTDWGELDYLIVDMPPGTGDIQLTLMQSVALTAAVIVTTPQNLSFVDVVKGINMFDSLKVPVVSVVENMSYFEMPDGSKNKIFGEGSLKKLVSQYGFRNAFEVPVITELSTAGDTGVPSVVAEPAGVIARTFADICSSTVREVSRVKFTKNEKPLVTSEEDGQVLKVLKKGDEPKFISAVDLRRACKCARCIDEMSGKPILDPSSVKEGIKITDIAVMGNYAVSIHFSDGHTSGVYSYDHLAELV